jgi:capsular polysaccharide transport system permease protein
VTGTEWQMWRGGVRTHVRVIGALVRREMRAHFESRIGYLWALLTPALHLGAFLLLFAVLLKRAIPIGTSTSLFLLTGIVPYFLFSKMASYVSSAIGSNRPLLLLPPVKVLDVVVARLVLEATTYLFVSFVMFSIIYMFGVSDAVPADPLALMAACTLAISFGLAMGLINIVLGSYIHNWLMFYGILTFPLWMFSGIFYLPEQIPQPFREYVIYNPIMHIVLLFRVSSYPTYKAPYLDVTYAVGVTIAFLALGLALMEVARRRVLDPL